MGQRDHAWECTRFTHEEQGLVRVWRYENPGLSSPRVLDSSDAGLDEIVDYVCDIATPNQAESRSAHICTDVLVDLGKK